MWNAWETVFCDYAPDYGPYYQTTVADSPSTADWRTRPVQAVAARMLLLFLNQKQEIRSENIRLKHCL